MLTEAWDRRLDRHEAFLECRPVDRPLIGPWRSGYYPAEQFPRGTARWQTGEVLQAEDVSFAPFADDYERLYASQQEDRRRFRLRRLRVLGYSVAGGDLGCRVVAAAANCCAKPCLTGLDKTGTGSEPHDDSRTLPGCREVPSPILLDTNAWLESTAAIHAGTRGLFGGPISGVSAVAARARRCGGRHVGRNGVRDRFFRRHRRNARIVGPLLPERGWRCSSVCRR